MAIAHRNDVKHLRFLVAAAQLPQGEFAPFLGVDAPTLSGYLNGATIPKRRQRLIRSIVAIESTADAVHIIYAKRASYGDRWEATLARREAHRINPRRDEIETIAATSRQLAGLLRSQRPRPEYSHLLREQG